MSDALVFYSREATTPEFRPRLEITLAPAGAASLEASDAEATSNDVAVALYMASLQDSSDPAAPAPAEEDSTAGEPFSPEVASADDAATDQFFALLASETDASTSGQPGEESSLLAPLALEEDQADPLGAMDA